MPSKSLADLAREGFANAQNANKRSIADLAFTDGVPGGGTTLPANSQTGTAYTLVASDAGKVIEVTNAAANTVTVPPDSDVDFAIGTVMEIYQGGAGQTTVAAGTGVTLTSRGNAFKLAGQYASARLRKTAANTWNVSGDVTA